MTPQDKTSNNEKKIRLPSKGLHADMAVETVDFLISTGACFFSEKRHDSLVRCQECNIKYDMFRLRLVSPGKFMCKYCVRGTHEKI